MASSCLDPRFTPSPRSQALQGSVRRMQRAMPRAPGDPERPHGRRTGGWNGKRPWRTEFWVWKRPEKMEQGTLTEMEWNSMIRSGSVELLLPHKLT